LPKQTILRGPIRPITELQIHRVYVDPADAKAIQSIPLGFAQETTLPRNKAASIIGKLERMNVIPKGAFRIRGFRDGNEKKVAIVHESDGEKRVGTSAKTSLPTTDEIEKFIESQEAYRHDLSTIAEQLIGRDVDSHGDSTTYYSLRKLTIQARENLEKKHGGKFSEESVGHHKFYVWKE
jgi:hypothetical protein